MATKPPTRNVYHQLVQHVKEKSTVWQCVYQKHIVKTIQKKNIKMGVSWNRGTPKSSILMGFPLYTHLFGDTPILGNPQMIHKPKPELWKHHLRTSRLPDIGKEAGASTWMPLWGIAPPILSMSRREPDRWCFLHGIFFGSHGKNAGVWWDSFRRINMGFMGVICLRSCCLFFLVSEPYGRDIFG